MSAVVCASISQSDLLLRGTGGGVFSESEPGGSAFIIHQNSHSVNAAGLQRSAALRTHSENKCSSQRHSINRFIIRTHRGCFLKPTAATAASYRGRRIRRRRWQESYCKRNPRGNGRVITHKRMQERCFSVGGVGGGVCRHLKKFERDV